METVIERDEVLDAQTVARLEQFVGKKAPYFIKRWQVKLNHTSGISWNFASFVFGIYWLGYRKLYKPVYIVLGIYLANDILLYLLQIDRVTIGFFIQVAIGLYANIWYYKFAMTNIHAIEAETDDPERIDGYLNARGGTSWKGVGYVLLLSILYVVVSVGLDLLIDALRYMV